MVLSISAGGAHMHEKHAPRWSGALMVQRFRSAEELRRDGALEVALVPLEHSQSAKRLPLKR